MTHNTRLVLVLALGLGAGFAISACGTPKPTGCSPATCSGCCTSTAECVPGNNNQQCGAQGNNCTVCGPNTNCEFGLCRTSGNGGGGGASGGGGGTTGGGAATGGGGSTGGGATGGGTTGGGGATGGGTGGGTTGGGGATGGGTGGGTTGGGGGMIFDAGTPGVDGGIFFPPTINLTFMNTCGPVAPCSGNEFGDWYYTAGCIDDGAFTRLTSVVSACNPVVTNKRGTVAGAVVFDGTNVVRNVVGEISFDLTLSGQCTLFCGQISSQLAQFGLQGSCAINPLMTTNCDCNLRADIGQNTNTSYTYTNGVLQTGMNESYDSCIAGQILNYRETTDGGITPGVFVLNHR